MTTIRKTLSCAIAAATLFTATLAPVAEATAGPRENWVQQHNGHRGGGNMATGLAIGLGLAILSHALKAPAKPHAVRSRKENCRLRDEWKKLLDEAEEALKRDRRINAKHPKYADAQAVKFGVREVARRRQQYDRFRMLCKQG